MKKCLLGLLIILINFNVFSQQNHSDFTSEESKKKKENLAQGKEKGLRKLTEEEKQKQLALPRLQIKKKSKALPSAVNNAEQSAFRPIFNQVGNCCGQASGVAYHYTYEMNLLWGTAADAPERQFPSHYTWNFLNGGKDYGSWYFDGWDIIIDNGCPTIETYGSINAGGDHTYWMSGYDKYKESMKNTIVEYQTIRLNTAQGISDLKQWMFDHGRGDAVGGLANFSALSFYYTAHNLPEGTAEAGKKVITNWGTDGAHAMTFVGYNDDICWDYNGDGQYTNDIDITGDGIVDLRDWEKGAFIVANSWGGNWENDGYAYYMYRMCAFTEADGGLQNNQLVHILNVKEKNDIDLTLKVKMRHSYRGALSFIVGINPDIESATPSKTRELVIFDEMGGYHGMNGQAVPGNTPFEFGIDISEYADQIIDDKARVFLEINSEDGTGEIISASIVDYRSGETEHHSQFNGKSIEKGSNEIFIDILPAGTPKLTMASTSFKETIDNDGQLSSSSILLENSSFSKATGNLVEDTDYTLSGVPAGLTASLTVVDANNVTFTLNGQATAHEEANNTNLELTFLDAAFTGNTADEIVGSVKELEILYRNEYTTEYLDLDDIVITDNSTWQFFSLNVGNADYGGWRFNNTNYPEYIYKLETYNKDVVCYAGTNNLIPLAYGDDITTSSPWYAYDRFPNQPDVYSTDFTEWAGQTAYIGIKITVYDGEYHGWIRASVAPDASNFTILDAAYYTKPSGDLKAGMAHETMLQFKYDTIYEDVVNNNGGFEDPLTARLFNCDFTVAANTVLVEGTHYNITGVPTGLQAEIKVLENNFLSISLNGHAESHNKSDLAQVNIEFLDALFDGIAASEIKNAEAYHMNISYLDEYKIVYKDVDDFTVSSSSAWVPFNLGNTDYAFGAWLNAGYLRLETYERDVIGYEGTLNAKPLEAGTTIDLNANWVETGAYPDEAFITNSGYTEWHGKDAYVGTTITRNGYPCYVWIRIEVNADGTAYTVKEWAYNEQPYAPIKTGETVYSKDPSISIGDGEFVEPYTNDGTLEGTAEIQVINDEFALEVGSSLTQGSHFTIDNLPEGLRCNIVVVSKNKLELSLIGEASNHKKENDCEFSIGLKDVVFRTNTAANVENSTFTCNVEFKEPWDIIYKDINDITVSKDYTFEWFYMGMGTHGFGAWWYNENGQMKFEAYENYVVCHPGTINLIPLEEGTLISYNSQEWYRGMTYPNEPDLDNDNFHEWIGNEAYVGVALKNGDLWHFGWIRIAVAADGLSYTVLDFAYNDQPGAPILAGQKIATDEAILDASKDSFMETYENDGSLNGKNSIAIVNGSFNTSLTELVAGTHYTVQDLPAGLEADLSIINNTELSLEITGKATDHLSINNQEFTITFMEAAFQDLTLDDLLSNECTFNIEFRNEYEVVYVDIADITCDADNTWTSLEIMPGLDRVGAWLYNWKNFKLETNSNKAICNPGTYQLKLLEANILLDQNTEGWTAYDEYPNQLDVTNQTYTTSNGKEGYVGLQLEDEGYLFHAWIRISVAADGKSYTILDFAYNEAPNKPIYTGSQTYIPVKPQVDFTADKTNIYKDETVTYQDLSTYDPTEWLWTFEGGDVTNSSDQNPSITYAQTGVFDVSLTATNADGSNDLTKVSMITVHEAGPAKADFNADMTIIKPGETVNFEDASVGIVNSWEWKFEGAATETSNEENPSVTYSEAGTYKVELIVKNEYGATQRIKNSYIIVQDTEGYCIPSHTECGYWYNINNVQLNNLSNSSDTHASSPVYTYYTDLQANLVQGESTTLVVNSTSTDRLYLSVYIDWNGDKDFEDAGESYTPVTMDDGSVSTNIDVPADAQLGYTRMRLRTKMDGSVSSSCSTESSRGETEDYNIYISASGVPVADFEANKTTIAAGESILLTDKSTNNPTSWAWNIEGADETTSNKASLYATYSTAGTYQVELTVSNAQGSDTETKAGYITVTVTKEAPDPEFSTDKTSVQSGETVSFLNETEYRADATFLWTFEGGNPETSTERDPEISYYYQGSYSVSLEVTTPEGTKDITKDDLIKVSEHHKPVAEFTSDKTIVAESGSVQFTDLSSNEPTSWGWVFEGGTPETSTDQNPSVTYSTAGTYKVSLIATNEFGVSDANEKVGYITVSAPGSYCIPGHAENGASYWNRINGITLNNLTFSGDHDAAIVYNDYSDQVADVEVGETTTLTVSTQTDDRLILSVFVDWNQDGNFSAEEKITESNVDGSGTTNLAFNVPNDATVGLTRLRVRSAFYNAVTDACSIETSSGETEDYTINVNPIPAPNAIFTVTNTEVEEGKSVIFSHSSEGNPTSIQWTFEGGTPASSTEENPVVTYATAGTYDVSLEVTNADGSDTETKIDYITVSEVASNHAPLNITLSENSVDEDATLNTLIGVFAAVDEDAGDSHTYTFATGDGSNDADNSSFTIDGANLKLNTSLDYETKTQYNIYIQVEDAAGETCNKAFTIEVNDVAENMPATEIILSGTSVDENLPTKTVVANLTATDPDAGDTHTFALQAADGVKDADNNSFSISGDQLLTEASFDYETKSELKINLRASDDKGNDFDQAFTISVNDIFENNDPTAINLSATSITENAASGIFMADITAIDVDPAESFTFELVEEAGFNSTHNDQFEIRGDELFTAASFDYETNSELYICLRVTDSHSGTFTKEFTIEVEDVDENNKPTDIQLSKYLVVKDAAIGSLVATISAVDQDADDVHTFRLYPGNSINDADNDKFTVDSDKLKLNADISSLSGYLKINLKVTDNAGSSITKAVEIEIVDEIVNSAPTDITLSNNTVAEDAAIGTVIGTLSATDVDANDTHTFTFADGGADNASFTISDNSLKLNTALDYETKDEYSIKLKVTDAAGESFEKGFTIKVTEVNVNNAPTDVVLSNNSIAEDAELGAVIGTLSAVDADENDTHTFSFAIGGVDNDSFTIEGTSLKLNTALDYETKSTYNIRIKVVDAKNEGFVKEIQINVTDVDENNAPIDIILSENSVAEDAEIGTIIGLLSATDSDAGDTHTFAFATGGVDNLSFTIEGNSLKLNTVLDYETKDSYSIKLKVTDAAGASFEKSLTINITDVNESPTDITLSKNTIAEDAEIGTAIGEFTASAKVQFTFAFADGGVDNTSFLIDGATLKLNTTLDYETKNTYSIKVEVSNGVKGSFEKDFVINVTDVEENNAPTDIILSNNSVSEDATLGTIIGQLSASDADVNDTHTFAFADGGTDNASFEIDGTSLKLNTALDYETKTSYSIKLEVTDAAGASFEKALTINVTDVEENNTPTDITLSNNSIAEDAALGTIIGELSATDADANDTHTFAFADGGTDNASFEIDGTSLKLNTALDYDVKTSYSIKVKVTDAADATFVKEFTIEVSDVTSTDDLSDIICKVYPNPVIDELRINCKDVDRVEIYNAIGGRELIHMNDPLNSEFSVDVSQLNSGIYFVKITFSNDNTELTRKIIK